MTIYAKELQRIRSACRPCHRATKKENRAMTTSTTTTTTAAGTSKGTRLAAALDQNPAGPEPLLDVAAWYVTQYNSVLSLDERLGP